MMSHHNVRFLAVLGLVAVCFIVQLFGVDVSALLLHNPDAALGVAALGMFGEISEASKQMLREELEQVIGSSKRFGRLQSDLLEVQQKMEKFNGSQGGPIVSSRDDEQLRELLTKACDGMRRRVSKEIAIELPPGALQLDAKSAIVNATGQNQPLVAADRLTGILAPAQRRFFVRDLLPVYATSSNMIEYCKENVFTNNAAIVYSSPNYENVTKPESTMTFTLATAAIQTIAHLMHASRQVLDDSSALMGYLDNRMTYGLKLTEQDEILNGDGTAGHFNGLMQQATAYAGTGAISADTQIDTLRRALAQLEALEYNANAIVLNPVDWMKIQLLKDTQGKYIFGGPSNLAAPNIWGIPVVATNQIAATRFLVGDMPQAAAIFDRQTPTLAISEHHNDNFAKNMVSLRVESRATLCVFRPNALIRGNFN